MGIRDYYKTEKSSDIYLVKVGSRVRFCRTDCLFRTVKKI